MSLLKTKNSFVDMRRRCNNPSNKDFANYGGRGITVCKQWDKFSAFVADMGIKPEGMQLGRRDTNLGYCPENCLWVTSIERNRNSNNVVNLTHDGVTMCVTQWSEKLGMDRTTIGKRLKAGWSVERALTTPASKKVAK